MYNEEIIKDSGYGNSRNEDLIRIVQGGRNQGTWLHQELAYEFAGWLSATFRRNLHKWAENRIKEEHHRKNERLQAITGFKPLTDAIQAAHDEPKHYHYSNECNLICRLVTGMDVKKFKALHNVSSVRDALCADDLRRMNEIQSCSASLIKLGFDFEQRKALLTKLNDNTLDGAA